MRRVKYLIIGAGITGLRFAGQLSDRDYLIIDKDSRIGGLCKTFYENGFVWDYAGHFFHFRTKEFKEFFENRIERNEIVRCKKKTKIYYKGEWIDYPFQKNIHQLNKTEFIECLSDVYFKKSSQTYHDFQDMLYGKFGKGITNKFLKPYNEKLYACRLSALDANAMGRFFPYAEFDEIMMNMRIEEGSSYNDIFQYPKRGAQEFVDVLKQDVADLHILLESELQNVDISKKLALVNGEEIHYDILINTMPLKHFSDLLDGIEDIPNMSGNKVLVFNLGFDKKTNIKDLHWIYFPDQEFNFYRVGFYDNILSKDVGSLYVEIGFSEEQCIDVESEFKKTILNLKKCGIIDETMELVKSMHLTIDLAYVHISKVDEIQKYKNKLSDFGIYSVGRYGGWTYCSIEDCLIEADQLAKELGEMK